MASTKITRTSSSSTEKKLTISYWLKRSYIGEEAIIGNTSNGANWAMFYFNGANKLQFASYIGGSYVMRYTTNRTFSDVGAWYHLVATVDVSLASPEVKVYVNGEEQTDLEYNVTPSQNADIGWFNAWNFEIGVMFGSSYYLNGYLSDLYYIQGYIYPASTFGQTDSTSGIWKPITNPTINYGGNGGNSCHLKFENSANMDLDSGSNNISFTTSGTITQTEDTPSNNFATLNPLIPQGLSYANGNLSPTHNASSWKTAYGTLAMSGTGKYYFESKVSTLGSYQGVGIVDAEQISSSAQMFADNSRGYAYKSTGQLENNNTEPATFSSYTTGDIIMTAVDLNAGAIWFGKNGTWQNSATQSEIEAGTTTNACFTGVSNAYVYLPAVAIYGSGTNQTNFGNGRFGTTALASSNSDSAGLGLFEYSVPSGYYSICTKNIKNYG